MTRPYRRTLRSVEPHQYRVAKTVESPAPSMPLSNAVIFNPEGGIGSACPGFAGVPR
jgi:hypothetical protein